MHLLQRLWARKGLGRHQARHLLARHGYTPHMALTAQERDRLEAFATQWYALDRDLEDRVQGHIRHHLRVGTYRGARHRDGLPLRGQRTHGNARTARKRAPVVP
jgi:small subunit ribosomal protein S13